MNDEEKPMERHEDGKTEFKREWAESIRKTVIAFANTEGGTLWVGVDEDCIRDMLREDSADSFESCRSFRQELTFEALSAAFRKRKIPFGLAQETTLGIRRPDGLFTNLAFLLSDQCRQTIKLAAFKGDVKDTFRDRREPEGSLLVQLDAALEFLCKWNDVQSEIRGFERVDSPDYDEEVIREALLNAVIHRDYSRQDSTLASVFSDRIEIVSIGGVVPGYDPVDLIDGGVSALRNRALANVFARLGYIEAYGTGIPKIRRSYAGIEPGPSFTFLPHAFRVVLPNRNVARRSSDGYDTGKFPSRPVVRESADVQYEASQSASTTATPREESILALLRQKETVTREEVQKAMGVSLATVLRDLAALLKARRVAKVGSGRNTRYRKYAVPNG